MENYREELRHGREHFCVFFKWIVCSIIVGVIVGGIGTVFHYAITFSAEAFSLSQTRMIWLMPIAGVIIVFSYKCCGLAHDKGTNMILISIRSEDKPSAFMAPLIFFSTALTHLTGGSAGREGAAIQMGGGIGYWLGRLMKLDEKDQKLIIMCGMSAAFSALFGTPVTAAIFSMEVISVGAMYYSALVPCVLSSLIGYCISIRSGISGTSYAIAEIPEITIASVAEVTVLAVLCGLLSILFCVAMHGVGHMLKKVFPNKYLRIVMASVLLINLTYIFDGGDYNGSGMNMLAAAVEQGSAVPYAFLIKLLFTAITLGAGFRGGEIVPSFVVGATFGCTVSGLLGLNGSFAASVGTVAVFCGVTNCPITSLILSIELFGSKGIIFFAVAIATSYMLSGYYGLYRGQKILYSKDRAVFINTSAH